ncbi:hypothetical protein NliqN6_6146 [Naganishia liquefaciens]|uniref:Uncharacterized protein n=1 Tax=Naganishia liquefaciens TaxID=104408 RepID=A0A8H3TZ38_9TREE|nr:hypothetical protein NliqN6_6146 [Naganishia liquefaciens]
MGLFGTSDPVKKEEKMLAKEAKHDDKLVKQALKDLEHTEKEEHRALKAHDKAVKEHAKAVEKEHKLAEQMNKVVHRHDEAVSKENKLAADIQARDQYHAKIEAELAAKKQAVEQATHRHHTNEAQREQRHAVLEHGHESTTPAVGSTAARTDDVTPGYGSATAGDGLATTGTDAAPVGSATTGGAVPVAERY